MRSCMPPMACGAAGECTGSFSSVSSTGEVVGEEFRLPYHGKPPFLAGSPPEIGEDDGDLRLVIAGTSVDPLSAPPAATKKKKKRSLPGTPDPSAEVIALSPRTLMATNRFVCEICHKGFQRDQNLQLHRRGHNLPWKLRQRGAEGGAPPRKRAYVCPEPACVHHDPRRALGDLTGIKKHFCRKHGEKKWKCDRCAKRYAVHSDWKAHAKVCGTREYRCDCGTLFSRRDSFVTHRAFCDALAQENSKLAQPAMNMATVASALQGQQHAHSHHLMLPSTHADDLDMDADEASAFEQPDIKSPHLKMFSDYDADAAAADNPLGCMLSSLGATTPSAFSPSSRLGMLGLQAGPSDAGAMGGGCYSPGNGSLASMSATALLQKAAQMGATTSSGYGGVSFTPGHPGLASTMAGLDRFPCTAGPFGPTRVYDGMVGFGVGGLMPGQLYNDDGARGADNLLEDERRRAAEEDDLRVVDYMGVQHQRTSFGSVATTSGGGRPFADHTGPWA
ncbi:protein indeterminate-domain 2-like [Hordeum vulgare]|uniref:Protein EARLY HEADING DATE 2 n=1 Tax=Hordeum vulgare subsp. vulgare TaxID=112509 RepID=A0A8I6WW03_HORVV|nr:zinc finger protein GAI-ASSOCIATED FACTOR 1-like [Hordeum vulgare subsp. vulgare]KAE8800767.1 protein indeterminate-domain 2-like [Hordeum vulgare]